MLCSVRIVQVLAQSPPRSSRPRPTARVHPLAASDFAVWWPHGLCGTSIELRCSVHASFMAASSNGGWKQGWARGVAVPSISDRVSHGYSKACFSHAPRALLWHMAQTASMQRPGYHPHLRTGDRLNQRHSSTRHSHVFLGRIL